MNRKDVNENEIWDLTSIYNTEYEYLKDLDLYDKMTQEFIENYKGKLNNIEIIKKAFDSYENILEILSKLNSYAYLPTTVDAFDEEASQRAFNFLNKHSQNNAKLSFFESELIQLDSITLKKLKEVDKLNMYIDYLIIKKKYALTPETERVLKSLSNTFHLPDNLYNKTKAKDIDFPDFEVNGQSISLSYNKFEGELEYEKDNDIRREAFRVFSETLKKYQNTTAGIYNGQVQYEKSISKIRGHESVIDYLLVPQKVSKELYNRQIDIIMKYLAPHMRKYAQILKRIHKLDVIKYSDLKIEVDPNYSKEISFEESKKYVLDGLKVLGDDYIKIIKNAFDNKCIDYAINDGKSTGAFCSSTYGKNSFVFMTFNGKMSDVMTLAHELGHAGHFILSQENQSIFNFDSSMYFVEAPSTTNELLVEMHLLKIAEENKDMRMKRWILSQMISKTYYHNFVTHFLEAWYQREVYKIVDNEGQLNARILNDIFKEALKRFWGDEVELDEGSELTWMRQPHYYMGLYPYTYSAGLTIGTQVARRIQKEGKVAADNWKEVLKLGGSKYPEELAKIAGVDISTEKPLLETIEYIKSLIDEIENISIELGDI